MWVIEGKSVLLQIPYLADEAEELVEWGDAEGAVGVGEGAH